jgi:hypothetical protein
MATRGPENRSRPSAPSTAAPHHLCSAFVQRTYINSICAAWLKRTASMPEEKAAAQMPCDRTAEIRTACDEADTTG